MSELGFRLSTRKSSKNVEHDKEALEKMGSVCPISSIEVETVFNIIRPDKDEEVGSVQMLSLLCEEVEAKLLNEAMDVQPELEETPKIFQPTEVVRVNRAQSRGDQ